ncbi:MAG TPA: helix-turn-helix domain-containing protein [Solirubrobacterales bacterium]|nr:helix-turn-helix domain-containing protein [Solirubrobacterales bacterium]
MIESGATLKEIAAEVDCSVSTVRHWLQRHGLKTKNRGGRLPVASARDVQAALAHGSRMIVGRCPSHGSTQFAIRESGRLRCKRCASEAGARRRRTVKALLVEEAGGRCELCGYDRCISALEFDHRDPSTKSFGVAHEGITRGIDEVRREVAKCVLLCSNCHAEVEAGLTTLA